MEIKIVKRNKEVSLALKDRFDFYAHRDFKKAYTPFLENKEFSTITVDLRDVLYLDSSAMGMLLLLKDGADQARKKVLINCGANDVIRDLLFAVSFNKIFEIS